MSSRHPEFKSELYERQNLLLTGRPGVGKTTLIRAVVEKLGPSKAGGFWSKEIRESGRRVGFSIETLSGQTGVLAHCGLSSGPRLGRYVVNIKDIEEIAVPSLVSARESDKLIIIDEIAKMELFSREFAHEVRRCLDNRRVIATIQQRREKFLDEVRARKDVRLLELTVSNRKEMPRRIIALLGI